MYKHIIIILELW